MHVPVNKFNLSGNEKKYVLEALESGWISSDGPFVKEFEEKFSKFIGKKHGIAVTNGTVALELAVESLGITKGDEVIVPTFTIISCVNAIVKAGATPVFVDSEIDTWNMDANKIESLINETTKAIMPVHTYGLPVDMDKIIKIANKHKLVIIEDAAEAHGQTFKGRNCGAFGDVSVFSFYANKNVTTGEGGMILTDSDTIAAKLKLLRNLSFESGRRFIHNSLSSNSRFTNIQSAIGLAQLEKIDSTIQKKIQIGKTYSKFLKGNQNIQLPLSSSFGSINHYWVYGILLNRKLEFDNISMIDKLKDFGVETRPFFWPMHLQPALKTKGFNQIAEFPVSEVLATRGLYLPSGVDTTEEEIAYCATKVNELTKDFN